jgi:hypothetical protein
MLRNRDSSSSQVFTANLIWAANLRDNTGVMSFGGGRFVAVSL